MVRSNNEIKHISKVGRNLNTGIQVGIFFSGKYCLLSFSTQKLCHITFICCNTPWYNVQYGILTLKNSYFLPLTSMLVTQLFCILVTQGWLKVSSLKRNLTLETELLPGDCRQQSSTNLTQTHLLLVTATIIAGLDPSEVHLGNQIIRFKIEVGYRGIQAQQFRKRTQTLLLGQIAVVQTYC